MNCDDHFFRGKNILITGGLGFIGSSLAIALVEQGANVTILDSMIPNFGGNLFNIDPIHSQVHVNISDMRDSTSLDTMVKDKEYIFHLAGQVSHGDSMRDPKLDLNVNCVSTMNLLESCRCYNLEARLIYTSTRQVYGITNQLPVSEDFPATPIDVNGINKLAAEYYHLLYDRTYGLRSTVLRLTNTYGPRQQIRNDRQGFIGIFLRMALKGEIIKIFGTGQQVRDFNYISDVVDALLLSAMTCDCYGNIYNLGSPNFYSMLEFVGVLESLCGTQYEIVPFPEDKKIIDIGDYYGDYSKFTKATGWHPQVDLKEGIQSSIEFFGKHKKEYWA